MMNIHSFSKRRRKHQAGASLIEVLVSMLILAFGMLALAGMLGYSVQMPKLAGYRATAAALASDHVERMRANVAGFIGDQYKETMTYNQSLPAVTLCTYPNCNANTIATLDKDQTNKAVRRELPQGGMRVTCDGSCTNRRGDLWIIWLEPTSVVALDAAASDECPMSNTPPTFSPFTDPKPRCLHVRFTL